MMVAKRKNDREIRERVLKELAERGLPGIRVQVSRGSVTLSGRVDSYGKQLQARDAAHRGSDRADLTDNIIVNLPGTSVRTDGELSEAVTRALEFDTFVPRQSIVVAVRRGYVALAGEVETALEREDVLRVVRHVAGVRGIQNRIRLKEYSLRAPERSGPPFKQP